MKCLCILTLAMLCLGVNRNSLAKIRNGYDVEILKTEKWVNQLRQIAQGPLNEKEREKMKNKVEEAQYRLNKLRENHAHTQEIIELFRAAAPELYGEMNTLQDGEGNETHIYIKVVAYLGGHLHGATNVEHKEDNPHVYTSWYGDHTVSIRITHVNTQKNLWSLVHELGHVRYQVPHLATYAAFYKEVYLDQHFSGIHGHHADDPSAFSVQETVKAFKKSWKAYKKEMKMMAKEQTEEIQASEKDNK